MNMLLSSLQDGSEIITLAQQAPATTAVLIDAPKHVLWFGFAAFIFIFVVALYMVIHARVIAPSRRKGSERAIFEPAGSSADITFDEAEFDSHKPDAHHHIKEGRPESHGDTAEEHAHDSSDQESDPGGDHPKEKHTQRAPFAGLFSRKPKKKATSEPTEHAADIADENQWADSDQTEHTDEHAPSSNALNEPFEYGVRPSVQTDQIRKLDDEVEARRRQAELNDTELINHEQDEFYARQRDEELREAEFERKKSNAALEQRMQSLASMERTLSETASTLRADTNAAQERLDTSIEERFAALSEELNTRLDMVATANAQTRHDQDTEASERELAKMADYVGRELNNLSTSMQDALQHLSKRIDAIHADPVDATGIAHQLAELKLAIGNNVTDDVGSHISLIDLVRNNLPVDRYSFGDPLPNGDSTDCRVKLTGNDAPLVIDAHYPVTAYDLYRREKAIPRKSQHAVNEYRRAILRHINYVTEKMIVSGETANSAMMFVPSEAILNDLHSNFSDLIEDSQRARVWIVSPTSLISTLNILSALAPASTPQKPAPPPTQREDEEVIAEIEGLRKRLSGHAQSVSTLPTALSITTDSSDHDVAIESDDEAGDAHPRPLSPEEEAFERLEREEKLAETAESEKTGVQSPRPPFPLR